MPSQEMQCKDTEKHGAHTWQPEQEKPWLRGLCPGYRPQPADDPSWPLGKRPRWVYGHGARDYPWGQCRYCGTASAHDCAPALCPLCASVICKRKGECDVCHYGLIPGFWRPDGKATCGYAGCAGPAITKAPRVHQACEQCIPRVKIRLTGRTITLTEYVQERIAHRDSGKGWENWRLVA